MDEAMNADDFSQEELRRRGVELQAALPEPKGLGAKWLGRKKRSSEGAETAENALDLAVAGGVWGLLLAIPGVVIWIVRRLRQRAS